jgi:hypothetical protein
MTLGPDLALLPPEAFAIVVPTRNARPWIARCLRSIAEQQTSWPWRCLVIDDASDDGTVDEIERVLADLLQEGIGAGFAFQRNSQRQTALANIVAGFESLGTRERPMDVLMAIDGDDWLFGNRVLESLVSTYATSHCWITWGGLITWPQGELVTAPVPGDVIEAGSYRSQPWRTSHLRTFRSHLWHAIQDSDLRDVDGHYYESTWDMAIMFPMLEMAGERVRQMRDALYVYNCENPNSDHVVRRPQQLAFEAEIRAKPPYQPLLMPQQPAPVTGLQDQLGFVLLSDADPGQALRLIRALTTYYRAAPIRCIHNRFASIVGALPPLANLCWSSHPQPFERGCFSFVEALIAGLKGLLAQAPSLEWIAVLDYDSYPIRPLSWLLHALSESSWDGYLQAEQIVPGAFQREWQQTCFQRYFGSTDCQPFREGFGCYAGSPWMLLRRKAVEQLLDFHEQEPRIAHHYQQLESHLRVVPEESYFHTILCNLPGLQLQHQAPCDVDWSSGRPRPLTVEAWPRLVAGSAFFAQPFDAQASADLMALIHDELLLAGISASG